jgi:hypothetical protein
MMGGGDNRMNFARAVQIWRSFLRGESQHRIAVALGVNPARVSEVIRGRRFPGSRDAALVETRLSAEDARPNIKPL